jgi:hypothetical protein
MQNTRLVSRLSELTVEIRHIHEVIRHRYRFSEEREVKT